MAPNMSAIVGQVQFAGVVLALVAIAAALAVVYIAQTGAGQVLKQLYNGFQHKQDLKKRERKFENRLKRERDNAEYRGWKSRRKF